MLRVLKVFLLFILVTAIEMLLFHINTYAQLSQHENGVTGIVEPPQYFTQPQPQPQPQPPPPPQQPQQHNRRESLNIEVKLPEHKKQVHHRPPPHQPAPAGKKLTPAETRAYKEKLV
jgi:hypothetical protein